MFVRGTGSAARDKHKEKIMAYVITNKCTCCGACKDSCPVEAISEGAPKFVIDADTCVDCGACTGACPNDAIEPGA